MIGFSIHNAGVGSSSLPIATTNSKTQYALCLLGFFI